MRFSECELRSSFFFFLSFFNQKHYAIKGNVCVCVCVRDLLFLGRAVKYGASDRVERTKKKKKTKKKEEKQGKKRAQLTT